MRSNDSYVLGINYRPLGGMSVGHHPSAVLLKNGEPFAMCEEERFVRIKEAPGLFPLNAITFCLQKAGITIKDVTAIGWNWDPLGSTERRKKQKGFFVSSFTSLLQFALRSTPLSAFQGIFTDSILPEKVIEKLRSQLFYWFAVGKEIPLYCFDHHLSHAASTYYTSGMDRATIVTWDSWGDHLSGLIADARDGEINVLKEIPYDQLSIGTLNDFCFEFLRTSEKGNLMGLAPYGKPASYLDDLVDVENLKMRVDLLNQTSPFPEVFLKRAGSPRRPGMEIEQRHKDLTADLQVKIESMGMKIVKQAVGMTGVRDVCFAGGCALNATMNGKIGRSGAVDHIFAQPDCGDGGGALGAAFLAYRKLGNKVPRKEMKHAYWGPSYKDEEIVRQLETARVPFEQASDADIADVVSDAIVNQKVVGWFQLGAEWGPRALGARSIIADPRREEVRDRVNEAVKYRDWWRPFAPSMLSEAADEFLEGAFFAPFMLMTFPVKAAHKPNLMGVTHVDGTTRPQMLIRDSNPRYYDMISAFNKKTGVPMVLNTSFNLKGEPLVNTPRDALRTFFSSGLDLLVLNSIIVRKK